MDPMAVEVKATFLSLMGKREEWYVSYPPSEGGQTTPSKQSYHVIQVTTGIETELQDAIFSTISSGIERMFAAEKVLYNTFWNTLWEKATFELLRSLRLVQLHVAQ